MDHTAEQVPSTSAAKKPLRPRFGRSQSASAELSPPRPHHDRSATSTTQASARRLHFPIPHSVDRARRGGEKLAHVLAEKTPVSAVADKVRGHERADGNKHNAFNDSQPSLVGSTTAPVDEAEAAPAKPPSRQVTKDDIERERHRRYKRNEELQKTMDGLSGLARDSTRRVDTMYYSILQKASALRSSIAGLKDLSHDSKRLLEAFEDNAGRVGKDLSQQVAAFGDFQNQQERVSSLEDRIQSGMNKTEELSDRLESARRRVELWERRENNWQARTSKRMRIGWTVFGVVLFLILLLLGIRQLYTSETPLTPRNIGLAAQINETLLDQMRNDFKADVETRPIKSLKMKPVETDTSSQRLRVLDEL